MQIFPIAILLLIALPRQQHALPLAKSKLLPLASLSNNSQRLLNISVFIREQHFTNYTHSWPKAETRMCLIHHHLCMGTARQGPETSAKSSRTCAMRIVCCPLHPSLNVPTVPQYVATMAPPDPLPDIYNQCRCRAQKHEYMYLRRKKNKRWAIRFKLVTTGYACLNRSRNPECAKFEC